MNIELLLDAPCSTVAKVTCDRLDFWRGCFLWKIVGFHLLLSEEAALESHADRMPFACTIPLQSMNKLWTSKRCAYCFLRSSCESALYNDADVHFLVGCSACCGLPRLIMARALALLALQHQQQSLRRRQVLEGCSDSSSTSKKVHF